MNAEHCQNSACYFATVAAENSASFALRRKVIDFLDALELVLGAADWDTTRGALSDDWIAHFINPNGGTFLEPGVADESSNWWNRGALLARYRDLKAALALGDKFA